jgi:hypothetical protein
MAHALMESTNSLVHVMKEYRVNYANSIMMTASASLVTTEEHAWMVSIRINVNVVLDGLVKTALSI